MAPDDQAAAALQLGQPIGRHRPRLDIGIVDDRPDFLATRLCGLDLNDPLGDPRLEYSKDLLDRTA
jgi:hypothetical protein